MCFLFSADQKRYSFLLRQLRNGDNVSRYEYPVMTTSSLDIFICTKCGIFRNQQSTYESRGDRGGLQKKVHMGHIFLSNYKEAPREAPKKIQHYSLVGTELQ